jgi:DnaJ-class molecular chaperone
MEENLYEILEIDRKSTIEQIKKQYKLLALKYHPDKNNGDETIFKKITNAHYILSDNNKKTLYDSKLDLHNKFIEIPSDSLYKQKANKISIHINLYEAIHGGEKTYQYESFSPCNDCNGTGIENHKYNTVECRECNGKGIHKEISFLSCMKCQGEGIFVINSKQCKSCRGTKHFKQNIIKSILLEPLIEHHSEIKVSPTVTLVIKHKYKELKNGHDHIHSLKLAQNVINITVNVSLLDLICGFHKNIAICDKTYCLVSNQTLDINKRITERYSDNVNITFSFMLQIQRDMHVTKKIANSLKQLIKKPLLPETSLVTEFHKINV